METSRSLVPLRQHRLQSEMFDIMIASLVSYVKANLSFSYRMATSHYKKPNPDQPTNEPSRYLGIKKKKHIWPFMNNVHVLITA